MRLKVKCCRAPGILGDQEARVPEAFYLGGAYKKVVVPKTR